MAMETIIYRKRKKQRKNLVQTQTLPRMVLRESVARAVYHTGKFISEISAHVLPR